jgi:O-antigen ligase
VIKKWVISSHGHDIFSAPDHRRVRAGGQGAMRRGGTTTGALAALLRRAAARPSSLLPLTAPVVAFLLVNRSWPAIVAVSVIGLALLAVCGPVAVLGLIPVSLLGGALRSTTVTLGAIAVVTLVVAVQLVAGTRRPRPAHLWVTLLGLLVLLAYVLPAGGVAPSPDRFSDLICVLAGLGLVAAVAASPPPPHVMARVTAVAGAVAAGWVLVTGDHPDGRLDGLGLNPNFLGALFALPLVAAVGLARRQRRPAWLVLAGVCLAGMVATQSRGALAAGAVGVALVLIQGRRRGIQVAIVAAAIALGTVFPGAIDAAEHAAVGGRRAAELSQNSSIREHVAWFAAKVAAEHPLRGIGYGIFPSYAENSSGLGIYIATHNDYLRLAAEAGIPALMVFLILIWLGMKSPASGEAAVPRAMVAAYAVGLLFANQLSNLVVSTPFWLALGCLLAAPATREHHIKSAQGVHT